jgi:effector-binding domain-containing protein
MVAARPLATIRTTTARSELAKTITRLLDEVWPALRGQNVRTGHNVIVYRGGDATSLDVEIGVEAFTEFNEVDDVRRSSTPAGEAATIAHYGDYSGLGAANAALGAWCRANKRHPTGVSWEVYGDWHEDPAKVRTDVYLLLDPASDD